MSLKVQYGCGLKAPQGWMNFDSSPTLRMQRVPLLGRFAPGVRFPRTARYGDVVKGLPVASGSADLVYCSHVIEHLALEDARAALRNTRTMLRSGGIFRLVVPDIRASAQQYLESSDERAALRFIAGTHLGRDRRPRGVVQMLRAVFASSWAHLWMWDYPSLAAELRDAGFREIRTATFGDSQIADFEEVEDRLRWERSVGIHCVR